MTDPSQSREDYPPAPPLRPSVEFRPGPVEQAARPRPGVISVSYGFWLGACLAGVVTAVVTLFDFDGLQRSLLAIVVREFPKEAPATSEDVATAALGIIIGCGVVLVLVQAMVAVSMNAGRRGARPVLVVLAVIAAVYAVAVYRSVQMETRVGLIVTAALMVIGIVLMFVVPQGQWFTGKQPVQYNVDD